MGIYPCTCVVGYDYEDVKHFFKHSGAGLTKRGLNHLNEYERSFYNKKNK